MKQRIITGIILILILIPIFISKLIYHVNDYFYILGFILTVIAMAELINMKETEKPLPFGIQIVAYLSVIYMGFYELIPSLFNHAIEFNIFDILPYLLIILIIYMVINNEFKMTDASFILFSVFYIGLAFHSLVHLFIIEQGIYILLYIVLIAIFSDTFAYFTGTFFGKHKLCPIISPKKTIEGSVGGTVIATILVSIYVLLTPNIDYPFDQSIFTIVGLTLLLSILSQFGDLAASVIKRQYKIKDYGNLFPGHGGVLDRLDSILFTSLSYFYLIELITKIF